MTNSATEDAIAKEEAQIAQLNGQIRRQNGHHHNHQHHNHSAVKGNEKKEKEKQVRPSIIRPSIFSHHLNVSKRNVSFHVCNRFWTVICVCVL